FHWPPTAIHRIRNCAHPALQGFLNPPNLWLQQQLISFFVLLIGYFIYFYYMKTLPFVWGFIAFSILGLDIFNQTETFVALQDFESNIKPAVHPEEFLPNWSANVVRDNSSRVFQEPGEGINGSKALGIQPIGSFNAQIYIKTTSKNLATPRISLQAKTRRNGSGNRPVYVFYSFSADEGTTFSVKQQIGSEDTFSNV